MSPAPVSKPVAEEAAKRTLAYQEAISQSREAKPGTDEAATDGDLPPFETVTSAPPPEPAGTGDPAAILDLPPDEDADAPQDMTQDTAALPDESADAPDDGNFQHDSQQMAAVPGDDQFGTDDAEQWGDERGQPWAYDRPAPGQAYGPPGQGDPYGDPYASQGDPYGQAEPYGQQGATEWVDQNTEEWVQVTISGAPMRATASEEAPMLFAFPYGRNLKVVSRFEGWVEVTDPKSAATGWMQAHVLAPSAMNRQAYGQTGAHYDEPRRRDGWLKRNSGGFADMINRALGGGGF